jgi:hypothetical protein
MFERERFENIPGAACFRWNRGHLPVRPWLGGERGDNHMILSVLSLVLGNGRRFARPAIQSGLHVPRTRIRHT